LIWDNCLSGQVHFLPCTGRRDGIAREGATDHQSAPQGSKVVTRHPTGHPLKPSCIRIRLGCTPVRIGGTWQEPTRMIGDGQHGTDQG